ncbi:hypothetical protein [Reyranella sp.]|jgi:hypothetical protein|uniref:hypothetical protein n=1 Tax=Reyranella sp. TaxID=1929291 RepID=UPI000BC5F500|nr:hypothetical protein [Reyranella sp.]OYY40448.1 MAG: hypothetical protein B7Y57_17210 [Rhodospirillales bacterium 35-66-84]OYZ93065.1 MAG: hypothetical protein B7Y08_18460 [Rhodospirillales bacterium 24-66-33]OZB24193.1 MAG: hypothetical protein B7X63_16420 [Rhodospirillales bacterium 39-66-50]HQS18788.1 hypothetical protein [Reyranella sp.]HQT14902.1 hypothetical protein [Reyranella sp.]
MRDMANNITPKPVLAPAVGTDDTALVGAIIDRLGFDSLTYLIQTGTLADAGATWTALLEESDDSGMSGANAVADTDLIGTEALAGFTQAADGKCLKLGYVGAKRYTRLTLTPSGNAGNAPISAMALLGMPHQRPTANPPA